MSTEVVLNKRVQIIIPLFNAVEYTKQAVESLRKNTHSNLYEVIFVDNNSTDGTKDFLKQLIQDDPEHFRVVTNTENKGFAGGINTGLQAISGLQWEYVCLANNDLLFTPNWLIQLLDCIQHAKLSNVGAVAPVSNAAGGTQGIKVGYSNVSEVDSWATSYHIAMNNNWTEEGMLVGLCFLMTRKLFDTVGYFDERFLGGMWEDNDYCLRARLAGFNLVVDRSTFLHHYFHKSFQGNKMDSGKLFRDNKRRYVEKWSDPDSPFEQLAINNAKARGQEPVLLPNGKVKKFLVAACRVKDGADYIEATLDRVSQMADEIVVLVSKLTTDNTKEICKKFPKVVLLEDDTDDQPGAKEADSRNRVLQMAYSRHPDWIHSFDHDEVPSKFFVKNVDKLLNPQNPEIMLWAFPIVQLWNSANQWRIDGLWGRFWQGRMFRALPGLAINNPNNLFHCGSHPTFPQQNVETVPYKIVHYGNVDSVVRKKKYERYTKIDTDKDLNMVLGGWKEYYWQLYYGQADPNEKALFTGRWQVIQDSKDWSRPKYGQFYQRDVYRHVYDETGMKLAPFSEDNSISLCMLIHNEGPMVSRCLDSIRHVVDEIICIDTGCTDATPEIAGQFGAEVHQFKWNDNFSDARNFSMSKASGDWILRLDPDEAVPAETASRILTMVREPNVEGFIFPINNWLEDPGAKADAQWALSETCRLFRNRYPTIKYTGIVHEELDDSYVQLRESRKAELKAAGLTDQQIDKMGFLVDIRRSPYNLWHFGYLRDQKFLDHKFSYYCQLGNEQIKQTPDDARPYFTTAVHYFHTGDYEKAILNYEKVLSLDPKHHMAMNDCGVIHWVQGRWDKAESYFRKALENIDDSVHAYHKSRVQQNLSKLKTQSLALTLLP